VLGVLWSFVRPLAQIEADYAGKLRPASDPLFLGKPATPAGKPTVFDLSRKAGYPSPLLQSRGSSLESTKQRIVLNLEVCINSSKCSQ
jgi:hypothetical protein